MSNEGSVLDELAFALFVYAAPEISISGAAYTNNFWCSIYKQRECQFVQNGAFVAHFILVPVRSPAPLISSKDYIIKMSNEGSVLDELAFALFVYAAREMMI